MVNSRPVIAIITKCRCFSRPLVRCKFYCGKRFSHSDAIKVTGMTKINSLEFQSIFTPGLHNLLNLFKKYNYEIRIAGGAVRDIIMGISPHDVDFATVATPQQMKEMFEKEEVRLINAKGEKHGTITARINDENFEVTTLRIDVSTDGRHAEVEFTTDWAKDASRRDLTINSMFLGTDGTLYDFYNGAEDLQKRRVVFVGDPSQRIREDYLRILRYFRFYGRIAASEDAHDENTLTSIHNNIAGLGKISGERIWVELNKIASGRFASSLIKKLVEVGAAELIGFPKEPNIEKMNAMFARSLGFELKPMTVIASLLGSAQEVIDFNSRVKLSTAEKNLGLFIVKHRDDDHSLKPLKLLLVTPQEILVTREQVSELLKYWGEPALLAEFEAWTTPRLPVNGTQLTERGVTPGKSVGLVLNELRMRWVGSEFKLSTEQLLAQLPSACEKVNVKLKKK